MNIKDLLYIIAKEYKDKNNFGISKTKLIKLAYLSEIFFKRQTGNRLTDSKWIFWKYGPYLMDYPEILNTETFIKADTDDFQPIKVNPDHTPSSYLKANEDIAIDSAMEFADKDLNDLLDFVYFDTEPMINVTSRGEELNFDHVMPEENYRIKKYTLTDEMKRDIKNKIMNWEQKKE